MSNIPHPEMVARGGLPSVEEMLALAHGAISHFSEYQGQLVLYGSLARGDATLRSDIDLCMTPSSDFYGYHVTDFIEREAQAKSWRIDVTVLDCASRRVEKARNEELREDPSGDIGALFSVTTYDHFGLLSRKEAFPAEIRRLYTQIQRDIRQYSGTDKNARIRDLATYVCRACADVEHFLSYHHIPKWRDNPRIIEKLGWMENVAYHVLRKLAGLAKLLKGTDGKGELGRLFDIPGRPFYAKLIRHFDVIRQFSLDIEEVLDRCLGRPELIGDYEAFLDERLEVMMGAVKTILDLLHREIEEKTLLETIANYDREAKKAVLLAERFNYWLDEWERERICSAIHWWCVRECVYVDSPARAFIEYRDEVLPLWAQAYFNGRKLNSRSITAEGRVEIDFTQSPVAMRSVCVRPTRPERPDYQQAAKLAGEAVMIKLREILPTDIVLAPSQ